jgi:hypothetical protein
LEKRQDKTDSIPIVENDSSLVLILKIFRDSLSKVNWNTQLILGIFEDHRVKLASVAIENRRIRVGRWSELGVYKLASPFVDFETMIL